MTLSIDDIKALVTTYEKEWRELRDQLLHVPDSVMMPYSDYDCDDEPSQTVADYIKNISLQHMPEEAIAMHAKLVEDMEKFSSIVNSKVDETVNFNEGIHAQLEQLLADFMAKINTIPEFQIDSCITINKKHVHPDDFDSFIEIYKALGFTHYVIMSGSDLLYYSRDTGHFNTIKDKFIDEMPRALRQRYPTILNFMQNGRIDTNPIHGNGLYKVMSAKQA